MIKPVKKTKTIYKLVALSLITTPLFAILGGTPFFKFDLKEFHDFLPAIYFTAVITMLFWLINISLLMVSGTYRLVKNMLLRALVSVGLALGVTAVGFYLYIPKNLAPPQIFAMEKPDFSKMRQQLFVQNNSNFKLPPDSVFALFSSAGMKMAEPRFFLFPIALHSLTINLIILTLCELVFLYFRKQKIEDENISLRQINLEAKNSQLKMQLHPHFLFNSLNTLKLLLKKDADKAEDYLLKLSDILRFSTTAALQNLIEVEEELKLCMAYLEMQKVRFGNMLHVVITDANLFNLKGKLPVYSLQLLAENAIKHNAFTNEEPLTIFIDYDAMEKSITVRNKIQPKRISEPTTMSGLSNLKKRYDLLNGGGIQISALNSEFRVTIDILAI